MRGIQYSAMTEGSRWYVSRVGFTGCQRRAGRFGAALLTVAVLLTGCGPVGIRSTSVHDDSSASPSDGPGLNPAGSSTSPSRSPAASTGSEGPFVWPPPDWPLPSAHPNVPAPGPNPVPDPACAVTEILEPSCGVWWGASPYRNDVESLERATGRPMDIVYTWHGIDQRDFPNERERRFVREGRFLHVNVEAREFDKSGHPALRYRQILRGEFDGSLRAQARRIADLGAPVFVTFDHEADASKRYNVRGTPEQFVRAWRRVVDTYRANGADNAIFVWNVTGWPDNLSRLPGLWPGNDYVDWISWEAYNMTGCRLHPGWKHVDSFEDALAPMYEWVQNEGPEHGIDPTKPVMVGEAGTVPIPGDREATEQWYAQIPDVLRDYERVRAVKFWDNTLGSGCDFRLLANRDSRAGFVRASQDEYVNLPEPARDAINDALALLDQFQPD